MAICERCGCEFEKSSAKRSIGRMYGAGTYQDYYQDADICVSCAVEQISGDIAVGAEVLELSGYDWDD